jgi:hypothetical protein
LLFWCGFHSSPTFPGSLKPIQTTNNAPATVNIAIAQIPQLEQIAALNAQNAIQLTRELSAANPEQARELGYQLIAGLQKTGAYGPAAQFAVAASENFRRDFVIAAYHEWGRRQPDQSLASAIHIADSTVRGLAIQSAFSGWARTDPDGMAEAALAFPEGEEKKAALTKALRAWMIKDPDVAGNWIMAHEAAIPVAEEFFTKDRR